MTRFPKPFFVTVRNVWRVQIDGRQINLGPDRDEAFRRYHELMGRPGSSHTPPHNCPHIVSVLDAFVGWLKERVRDGTKAERTLRWYVAYLQSLASFCAPDFRVRDLTVEQLQPFHVYQWVDSHPNWKTGKRGAMTAVQRAFRWAARAGHLRAIGGVSPIASLEKPPQGRRELLVTPGEYAEILATVRDRPFRDLVETAWETGARPNELVTVEARFVDAANARWVFPARRSKGKRVQRVVYLTDKALEITTRLARQHPSGPLFRNTDGEPWTMYAVNCRFQRLRVAIGTKRLTALGSIPPKIRRLTARERADVARRDAHEAAVLARRRQIAELAKDHCPKYSLYCFRHAFVTSALTNGVDAVTVSLLAGHRDTTMISRVYSHLTQVPGHLREAARRAKGG